MYVSKLSICIYSIIPFKQFLNSSDTTLEREEKYSPKVEGYTSAGDENSVSSTQSSLLQKSRPLFPALESSNSSEGGAAEVDKRTHFNPNTSSAMAKIAQVFFLLIFVKRDLYFLNVNDTLNTLFCNMQGLF